MDNVKVKGTTLKIGKTYKIALNNFAICGLFKGVDKNGNLLFEQDVCSWILNDIRSRLIYYLDDSQTGLCELSRWSCIPLEELSVFVENGCIGAERILILREYLEKKGY